LVTTKIYKGKANDNNHKKEKILNIKRKKSLFGRTVQYALWIFGIMLLIFLGFSLIPISPTVKPIQPRPDTQYWTLNDGNKIAYTRIEGDALGQNPPIIFLHGGPGG
jgi:hypothetical protein